MSSSENLQLPLLFTCIQAYLEMFKVASDRRLSLLFVLTRLHSLSFLFLSSHSWFGKSVTSQRRVTTAGGDRWEWHKALVTALSPLHWFNSQLSWKSVLLWAEDTNRRHRRMKRASLKESDRRTFRIALFNLGALFVSRLLIDDYELELINLRSPSYPVHLEFARPGSTSPTE